jgi:antitoxin HigA-1
VKYHPLLSPIPARARHRGRARRPRSVSADTAMHLARYFGSDSLSRLNSHAAFDLRVAQIANAKRIEREIAPSTA